MAVDCFVNRAQMPEKFKILLFKKKKKEMFKIPMLEQGSFKQCKRRYATNRASEPKNHGDWTSS